MKFGTALKSLVFAGVALASSAFSASIYSSSLISADGSASDRVILGANGNLLTSGYAAIGSFNGLDDAQVSAGANPGSILGLTTSFAALGSDNFQAGNQNNYGGSVAGNFVINVEGLNPTPLIGTSLYIFIGNGATLETSTAFALFRLDQTLAADPAPPGLPTVYSLGLNNGTLVYGNQSTAANYSSDTLGIDSTTVGAIQLVPVPEPSAALLGLLGAVGLIRRRR